MHCNLQCAGHAYIFVKFILKDFIFDDKINDIVLKNYFLIVCC